MTMPHCDSSILHAPTECEYCDMYPEWQAYRKLAGIAFTGHVPESHEVSCPSEIHRALKQINQWPGNRPAAPDA